MSEDPNYLSIVATGASLCSIVFALFMALEKVMTEESKRQISSLFLAGMDLDFRSRFHQIVDVYVDFFSILFGDRIFSFERIRKSWVVSSAIVIISTFAWAILRPEQFIALLEKTDRDVFAALTGVVFSAYLLNLVPDFLSVLQTRYFVEIIRKTRNQNFMILLLILDLLITSFIFTIFFIFVIQGFDFVIYFVAEIRRVWDVFDISSSREAVTWLYETAPQMTVSTLGNPSIGIFFYSTFFSSFILLNIVFVLLVGNMLQNFLNRSVRVFGRLGYVFDSDQHPVLVLGFFATVMTAFLYGAIVALL